MSAVASPEIVQPEYLWVPEHVATSGPEAADLATSIGIVLDPEQRLALDVLLAERGDGKWAAFEAALIAARQNLKTFLFEIIVLADLYVFDSELVVWTAHEFNTAMEAFRNVKQRIEAWPHLSRRVKSINEANGEEGIEFHTGQRLRFKARTKTGGRGLTGDRVILDEAFALQPSMLGSLMPTMSAKSITGNPQILYGSSAGKVESEVLRRVRDRGRAGDDPSLAYIEWCAPRRPCAAERCMHQPGAIGCQLDDPKNWRKANPAMGRRISQEHIAAERRSMPPQEFARERLGWWEDPESVAAALPLEAWRECMDRYSQVATVKAFAYDVALESEWAAIAVAGVRADGMPHLEVVEYRPGTAWLASRLAELLSDHGVVPVATDARGPGAALLPEVRDAGVEVEEVSSTDMARACGGLVDLLVRRWLRHIGQGELDTAAKGAVRREVGDAWAWSRRKSPVEISPLVACTAALWASGLTLEQEEVGELISF